MSRRGVGGTACRPQPPNQEILGGLWPRQSFLGGPMAKNPPANAGDTEDGVPSLGQKDPWRRKWQPTSIFLPGKSLGQRSPTGYSPRGYKRVGHDLASEQNNSDGKPAFCSSGPHLWLDSHSWFLEGTHVFQYNSVWGLESLSSLRNTLTEKTGEDDNRGSSLLPGVHRMLSRSEPRQLSRVLVEPAYSVEQMLWPEFVNVPQWLYATERAAIWF